MKICVSFLVLLVSTFCGVRSLECYSCDSDLMDADCDSINALPKRACAEVSDSSLVSLTCGYKRVQVGNLTDRIFRGCMVAGECYLLNRQAELTSKYRMVSCVECNSDHCNTMRNGAGRETAGSILMLLLVAIFKSFAM
nr:uncharacterized protein LOC115259220 [Aedes albopictus]